MKSIILTGGGTAGHIMPNMALLPSLKKHFDKIFYIASAGMEESIAKKYNVPFFNVECVKLDRNNLLSNLKIPTALTKGISQAKALLKKLNAGLVFSKGGYASLPTALAAKMLGIPLIVHESDFSFGVANRLEAKFACRTLTSFPETAGGEYVGNPIRAEILHGNKLNAIKLLHDYRPDLPTLLVFGGSLGAEFINKLIWECLPELTKNRQVVHITGKNCNTPPKADKYTAIPYTDNIADFYALANNIVMRGGANSLSEVYTLGIPSLVIPLPKGSNSRGDQTENALSYAKRKAVTLLKQENANRETLLGVIKYLDMQPRGTVQAELPNDLITKIICEEFYKRN